MDRMVINSITSKDNQKLKIARKTAAGKNKSLIFAEGLRLVKDLLESNPVNSEIFVSTDFIEHHSKFIDAISDSDTSVFALSNKIFDSIAQTKQSQGIALLAERPQTGKENIEEKLSNAHNRLKAVLLLDEINNPSNLGAILRTASAADTTGIVLTPNSADPFSPKALRGSMGASLKIPIWENVCFEDALEWATQKGLIATAADVNSDKSYSDIDWKRGRLLIFGSEAHGLSVEKRDMVGESIFIPLQNGIESLNVAVSCGIILFEAKRQAELNKVK